MRTEIISALVIVIALSVGSSSGAPMQEGKARPEPVSGTSGAQSALPNGFQLSAHIEKETFSPREPIMLRVSAINNTQKVFYLRDTRHPEFDYGLQVKDEKGKDLPLTKQGRDLMENFAIFRQVAVEVKPGADVHHEFNIGKLFNLAPGLITITVKRVAWEASSGFTTFSTNSIDIRITD